MVTVPDSDGPQVILYGFPTGTTSPEFGVNTGFEVTLKVVGVVYAQAVEPRAKMVETMLREYILVDILLIIWIVNYLV